MDQQAFLKILPALVKEFRPAPEVIARIGNLSLLIVVGPSGVGKTTLMHETGLPMVLTDTTREPRAGEREGVDFYFRKDYEQVVAEMKSGNFVQVVTDSGGDLKATRASSYPESGMAALGVLAEVVPAFRKMGFADTISAFITPPSYQEWQRRIENHKLSPEQRSSRLAEAERSIKFSLADNQVHFILNDDLKTAAKQLKELIAGRVDSEREQRAIAAAKLILEQLQSANG